MNCQTIFNSYCGLFSLLWSTCICRHVITSSMDQKSNLRVPALKLEFPGDPPSRTTHHVSDWNRVRWAGFVEPFEEHFGSIFFLVFEKFSTSRHWKSSRFNFESFSTLNFWIMLLENVYRHKLRSLEPNEDCDFFLRSSPYKPDIGPFSRKSKNSKNQKCQQNLQKSKLPLSKMPLR